MFGPAQTLLGETCKKWFKMDYAARVLVTAGRRLVYGDFLDPRAPVKKYRESSDEEKLKRVVNEKLEEYNAMYPNATMDLVLFRDAVEHVSRVVRVIKQPLGNSLLIGVGGSGRQSLTRLASFMCEYETVQVRARARRGGARRRCVNAIAPNKCPPHRVIIRHSPLKHKL